jgi:hypothetical protein
LFPPRTTIRSITACMLACGLLATTTSAAGARPIDDARAGARTSSLAGTMSTTPRQDLRSPDARDAARGGVQDLRSPDARDAAVVESIARTMEDYYATLGQPEPVIPPAGPAPTDDSPWLLVGAIGTALALVTGSAAHLLRRRRAAGATT